MPGANQAPRAGTQIDGAIERANRLERKTPGLVVAQLEPIVFTYPGDIEPLIESAPCYVVAPTVYIELRVSITAVAAGDNDLELHVSGSNVLSFTLPASTLTKVISCAVVQFPGTPLTVVTTATVSGANISVILRRHPK